MLILQVSPAYNSKLEVNHEQRLSLYAIVLALMFWYGGNLLADLELSVDDYFIIYTAILFGGQAAAFAIGFTSCKCLTLVVIKFFFR